MSAELLPDLGDRVVVLDGRRAASPNDWRDMAVVAARTASVGSPAALIVDVRAEGFTPTARDVDILASALARFPLVAIVTRSGAPFGCARMVCTLVELRGSPAAAFQEEAAAWSWISTQLGKDVRGEAPRAGVGL